MSLPTEIVPALAAALAARGYETLTAVQTAMLEQNAQGRDLLVSAQTGSGKTVAFGIAIAPTLLEDAEKLPPAATPLAMVIAPTRELALQVQRELSWLYADADARIVSAVGGMDVRTERRALERGAHIVVGTPGRLRDHITRGALNLDAMRAIVLDEADEMLDLGFREDLEFILGAAPEDRRTLMFSATVPKQIAALAENFQRDALRISATSANQQHGDIEYKVMTVPAHEREKAIINTLLYMDAANTIVFCHTRESVKHLASNLLERGFPVVALSGELSQAERNTALNSMRDGRARICVATDVAARGIDLPNLDLVIHADVPGNPDTLLHRSGRTGRAGRKGTCILVAAAHRRGAVTRVLKLARLEATNMSPPTIAEINAKYRQSIVNDAVLTTEPDEELAAFAQDLLEKHTPEQIAAAYLTLQMAARPAPEEVTEGQNFDKNKRERPDRADRDGKFEPRERFERSEGPIERFDDGVWFKISLGRKQRAEPRWLLPMICKAGGVTKSAVGSIKIFDTETQFEISAKQVESFQSELRNGQLEKGVTIARVDGAAIVGEKPKAKKKESSWTPEGAEPANFVSAKPASAPKAKVRDKAAAPRKDKGKPKWAGKKPAADAGGETYRPKKAD